MSIAHLAVYAQTPNEVESKDLYLKTLIQELEQESGVNIYYESAILDEIILDSLANGNSYANS